MPEIIRIFDESTGNTIIRVVTEGPQGISAYEHWISQGNTGTVQDFLNSLKANTVIVEPTNLEIEDGEVEWALTNLQAGKLIMSANAKLMAPSGIEEGAEYTLYVRNGETPYNLTFSNRYIFGSINSSVSNEANKVTLYKFFGTNNSLMCISKAILDPALRPEIATAPVISGGNTVGSTLSVTFSDTVDGVTPITNIYRLYKGNLVLIEDSDPNEVTGYVITEEDRGNFFWAEHVATNSAGSDTVFSPNFDAEAPPSPYSETADALFARMEEDLDTEYKEYVDRCINDLIAGGIWEKLDILMVPALATPQQGLLNWVQDQYNGTAYGVMDFTPFRGFAGNGGGEGNQNFYIDPQFIPNQIGTKAQPGDMMFGGVIQDPINTNNTPRTIVSYTATGYQCRLRPNGVSTNAGQYGVERGGTRVFTFNPIAPAHFVANRIGTAEGMYKNGAGIESNTNTAATHTYGENGWLFMANYSHALGVVDAFATGRYSAFYVGSGLTTDEISELYYILNEFLAAVGAEDRKYRPQAAALLSVSPNSLLQNDEVTYTLELVEGLYTGSVDVEVLSLDDSNFSASFVAALDAAVSGATGVSFDGVKTLTFDETFSGTLEWSRTLTTDPAAGTAHEISITATDNLIPLKSYTAAIINAGAVSMPPRMLGVNLAGAEFGGFAFYQNAATVDYYMDKGFKIFRLPMKWSRLQPTLYGELSSYDINSYLVAVLRVLERDGYALIDPHDYGGRTVDGVSRKIGDTQLPLSAFLDWWDRLTDAIGDDPNVIYCLNNEPSGIGKTRWWSVAQALTEFLRAKGITNHLQVPGVSYSTASSWVSSGNADMALEFVDPIGNHSFDVHQYLDPTSSGQSGVCSVGANSRIDAALSWAVANNKKMFFGEFGSGDPTITENAQCGTELPAMLDKIMESTASVGGTAWAGGKNWNETYPFRLEPPLYSDPEKAVLTILRTYLPA